MPNSMNGCQLIVERLPKIEEKLAAAKDAVYTVKPMDGAPSMAAGSRMSAFQNRTNTVKMKEILSTGGKNA